MSMFITTIVFQNGMQEKIEYGVANTDPEIILQEEKEFIENLMKKAEPDELGFVNVLFYDDALELRYKPESILYIKYQLEEDE